MDERLRRVRVMLDSVDAARKADAFTVENGLPSPLNEASLVGTICLEMDKWREDVIRQSFDKGVSNRGPLGLPTHR